MKLRNIVKYAGAVATAALLALSASAQAQTRIRLGLPALTEALPAVAADKLGYFKAEGIDLEITKFNNSIMSVSLLHAGKIEIAMSSVVSNLQAIEQGMDLRILAGGAVFGRDPNAGTMGYMVRKGELSSPRALEGKRVGINALGGIAWLYLVAYLDKHGVDRSKVRFVEVPFPQLGDALLNGSIDAAGYAEPFITILKEGGKAERLGGDPMIEVQPGGDGTHYVANAEWLKKNGDAAERFKRALRKGVDYISKPENEPFARDLNLQYTNLNPAYRDRVVLPAYSHNVNLDEVRKTQALMVKYGMLRNVVNISDYTVK